MNRYWLLAIVLGCAVDWHVAAAQDAVACAAYSFSPATVRAEGVTELVGDILMWCVGGTPVSTGTVIPAYDIQLTFNAPVTSRIIGSDGQSSEALLLVDEPDPTAQFPCEQASGVCQSVGNGTGTGYYGGDASTNRNVFQGLQTAGNTLLWKAVPLDPPGTDSSGNGLYRFFRIKNVRLDATSLTRGAPDLGTITLRITGNGLYRFFRIKNVRLDATSLTGGATDLGTISISITGTVGTIPVDNGVLTLGTASPSLTAVVRDAGDKNTVAAGATVGVGAAATVARVATLSFVGGFPGADMARTAATYIDADTSPPPVDQNVAGTSYGTETGFYNSTFGSYGARGDLSTAGLADSGTRYMAVIDNVPDGFTVSVDVYSSGTVGTAPTARLISTGAAGDGAFAATPATGTTADLTVIEIGRASCRERG